MSKLSIKVENLSKQYRLGTVGTKTLRGDLQRWWCRITKKEDPTLKIGQINQLNKKNQNDYVWALKNINFEVKQGEILGIIGKNGAGKSTLLKILSKVTAPTTGTIKINGRLASLLEVGTGFHPELTGRENIFLNGAILGMSKSEIRAKFDEIVDFAGVAKYVDTPVKRYSSGMYVRLAFAVAAHLEPDILVVDEVLAVGDAEFQKKAIGKMQDVSKGEGRTVLFVSHNMASIKALCNRGCLLVNGGIDYVGAIENVVDRYLQEDNTKTGAIVTWENNNWKGDNIKIQKIAIGEKNQKYKTTFDPSEPIFVFINYSLLNDIRGLRINISIKTTTGELVFVTSSHYLTQEKQKSGQYRIICELPSKLFNTIDYVLYVDADIPGVSVICHNFKALTFSVIGMSYHGSSFAEKWPGIISPSVNWELEKI